MGKRSMSDIVEKPSQTRFQYQLITLVFKL